ncbi:MAG: hypothetical protein ACLPOO_14785 [Terriglobales bacterium]
MEVFGDRNRCRGWDTPSINSAELDNSCSSLTATQYVQLQLPSVPGSVSCTVYRISPSANPGKIATGIPCGSTIYDFSSGTVIDNSSPPSNNSTGSVSAAGVVSAQAFNAVGGTAGTDILTAGTPGLSICPSAPPIPPCIQSGGQFFFQAPGAIGTSWGIMLPTAAPPANGALLLSAATGTPSTSTATESTLSNPSGTELATATGTLPASDLVMWDTNGNAVDSTIHVSGSPLKIPLSGISATLSNPSGTELATATGTLTTNDLMKWDGSGNAVDSQLSASALTLTVWFTEPLLVSGNSLSLTGGTVAQLYGFVLPYYLSTSTVSYNITTGDTSGYSYDIGFYDAGGNLKVHTGNKAASFFSTGFHDGVAWTSAATLAPGKYYFAITTSCTASCASTAAKMSTTTSTLGMTFQSGGTVGVTAGGTLNGSVTLPSDTYTASGALPALAVH